MIEGEILKLSVEEYSRLQGYMLLVKKDSEAYKAMKIRYAELKVILTSSGVKSISQAPFYDKYSLFKCFHTKAVLQG